MSRRPRRAARNVVTYLSTARPTDNELMRRRRNGIRRQNGNALWFILIVVVLFGALAATLSRNTGTVNQSGDIEQARVRATSILRYTTSIETAVQRMMLEGLGENDLNFEDIGSDYENTNCTEERCKVFSVAGGGIPYRDLPSVLGDNNAGEWIVSAQNRIYLAGCDDASNACTDLLLIAPDISKTVCMQINAIQRITNPDNAPPIMESLMTDVPFDGDFTSAINGFSLGGNGANEATQTQGKSSACVDVSGTYTFYQLLLAR